MASELNKYSKTITQPPVQGASQAMLYGTGMTSEDMNKAQAVSYTHLTLPTILLV